MSDKRDDTPVSRFADSMSSLFARAEADYRSSIDETRAWKRLQTRLSAESGTLSARRYGWVFAAAAACVILASAGWEWGARQLVASRANPVPVTLSSPLDATLTSIRLAEGRSTLLDGTAVELSDGAEGTYTTTSSQSNLEINRGHLKIAVSHQAPGHVFAVKALSYQFVVLGTQFAVAIQGSRVTLDVSEGRVAVRDANHLLRVVELGGHWSNEADVPVQPAPAPVESAKIQVSSSPSKPETVAVEPIEIPSDPASCRDLLRNGKTNQAERCYLAIASRGGLSAEMSLYEVARLRRDVLANPSSALAALDEYESRFPAGTLAPEVSAARVDLLARLGRTDEALTESGRLLASAGGRARTVELRLLRGNLLRDKKHDCMAAILEYEQIESDPGPRGDQAQFSHARCLQQLGRNDAAVRVYRDYVARPNAQRADAARSYIEGIQP